MIFYQDVDELQLLNDAVEAGGMAWWMMEYPSGAVYFHPNKIKLLGFGAQNTDQFIHYSSFTDRLHPDDCDKTMKAMMDHIQGKTSTYQAKYRIKDKQGGYRTFFDRGRIVAKDKEDNMAIAGIVLDMPESE